MIKQYASNISATTNRQDGVPDSKVHGANMGPTWVLSAPDGPHVNPMNLAIGVYHSNIKSATAGVII